MKLATAGRHRITGQVTRWWGYGGWRGRLRVASLALGAVSLCAAVTGATVTAAAGVTGAPVPAVLTGLPVPADQLQAINTAAASCPELTAPRLAAQVMEASGFNPDATTAGGGSGVAGLTAAQWQQWVPAPGAARTDVTANILALAHDICDLAGHVRAAAVPGDLWRLALAAFHVGLPAVIAADGIPADAAGYVSTVAAYAAWYAQQPQFGGTGAATPTPMPTTSATASPSATPGGAQQASGSAGNCQLQGSCPVAEPVHETVNVTVPVNTYASADTVYLAGNLSALGLGQSDWAPGGIPMTQVSADEWTATVYAAADTTLSYKYDLGGSWSNVEETASCGYVANRSMPVNGGTQNDVVANWAGPGACGDSGAVISVTVPSDTPSADTVYLSGNYDVLGTGIPSYDDWLAMDYPMIETGPDTWTLTITGVPVADFQYKFTLGSWSSVEQTSSCGYVANRTFDFNTADETYSASDTVAAWEGVGSC